jgi:hypothetical protein
MALALDMGRCRPSNVLTILAVRFLKTKTRLMLGAVETPIPALDLFHTQRSFSSANTILLPAVSSPALPPVHADQSDWSISAPLGRRRGSVPERP